MAGQGPAGDIKLNQTAYQQLARMNTLITHDFSGLVKQLNTAGTHRSEPNNWAGPLADRFRNDVWPKAKGDLDKLNTALVDLHRQVQSIMDAITAAASGRG
jgi:hypothetical protein